MREMKCPNCGAPLRRGWECEYCGSVDSFNVAQAVRDGLLTRNQARRVLGLEPENDFIVLDFDKLPIVSSALYENASVAALSYANPALCVKTPALPTKTIR